MNTKIFVGGALALILIIGAVFLLSNKSNTNKTSQPAQPTKQQSQPTAVPTQVTASPSETMMEEKKTVTLTTNGFDPKTITVKAGTKVTWINKSGMVATVDSAVHPTHREYSPLNLGEFKDGETLSLVFDKLGTYRYHDHLNPGHNGTVVVE